MLEVTDTGAIQINDTMHYGDFLLLTLFQWRI